MTKIQNKKVLILFALSVLIGLMPPWPFCKEQTMTRKDNAQCRAYAKWYNLQLLEWRDELVNRMMQQGGPALRSAYRLHIHLGWRESLSDFVIRWCEPSSAAEKEYLMLKTAYRDYLDLFTIPKPEAPNPKKQSKEGYSS